MPLYDIPLLLCYARTVERLIAPLFHAIVHLTAKEILHTHAALRRLAPASTVRI